ncbi:MAG: CehA/McbA family metallohydrolase [bacterium]|nr:CehA/McbA family metallohydrolase [bacterium]
MAGLWEYAGVLHAHSRYSDGSGTVPELVAAARRSRLDFLILTDHSTLAARDVEGEGWRDGVLLLVGMEITPRHNHYLALGVKQPVPADENARVYVEAVQKQGGLGLAAHPSDRGSPFLGIPSFEWNATDLPIQGLEVWNFFSRWLGRIRGPVSLVRGILNPYCLVPGPEPEDLARWDELGRSRRLPGVGAVDAHGSPVLSTRLLPYHRMFRTVRTHVLLESPFSGDAGLDSARLLAAMGEGRCFIQAGPWPPRRGFRFTAQAGGHVHHQGAELREEARFEVSLPAAAGISLLKDGRPYVRVRGRRLECPSAGPGVYRVEVHRRWAGRARPWIFSNPIYLR